MAGGTRDSVSRYSRDDRMGAGGAANTRYDYNQLPDTTDANVCACADVSYRSAAFHVLFCRLAGGYGLQRMHNVVQVLYPSSEADFVSCISRTTMYYWRETCIKRHGRKWMFSRVSMCGKWRRQRLYQ